METRRRSTVLDHHGQPNHHPAQRAHDAVAHFQVGLEDEERDSAPEDDFQRAENGIGFVRVPALEGGGVFGEKHVEEDNQGFCALCHILAFEKVLMNEWVVWNSIHGDWKRRGEGSVHTMPNAIVLARVRGWFFMKSLGTDRPITVVMRRHWRMWRGSL